jgi:hypothetical protein
LSRYHHHRHPHHPQGSSWQHQSKSSNIISSS